MDFNNVLKIIFEVCIIPILGTITVVITNLISKKAKQITEKTNNDALDETIERVADLISKAVVATNQTYVSSLKKEGKFDAEAQKAAFQTTYNTVLSLLSEESQAILENAFGDITDYLTIEIEKTVNYNK